jgi:N6-L-threonylcarbamoyladenine synthase
MKILGIESSCDETAAAVVEDGQNILSNVVASQFDLHRPFGGVVPEVAARAHAERITAIIDEAMTLAKCSPADIDAVSVVNRPGLVGALLVGLAAAKGLAIAWDKPLLGIDHIWGHVYASTLAGFNVFPHISLIVSGGHTCLYRVENPLAISVLGQTADDAAGEAFDKVAKMLELGFPGGPALSKLAESVPPERRGLFSDVARAAIQPDNRPKLLQEPGGLDFSFSGLKTAVYYHLRGTSQGRGPLREISETEKAEVAASFQEAACEIMVTKTLAAAKRERIYSVAIGGGVACNRRLRDLFKERAAAQTPKVDVFFPPPALCTDNAAMSAGLAFHRASRGEIDTWELDADPTPKRA